MSFAFGLLSSLPGQLGNIQTVTYSLVENTMLSCRSTRGAVTASATDAYAGPHARMCEVMGFD